MGWVRDVAAGDHDFHEFDGPHGGLRPFHQKSTCLTQLTFGACVLQIWSRNTPESAVDETFVSHRGDSAEQESSCVAFPKKRKKGGV